MTGPEALTGSQVAERISQAVGRTIRYVNVAPDEWRQRLLAAGMSPDRVDALDELFRERRQHPESSVYLGTHDVFGIRATPFAEFARRNAAIFSGSSKVQALAPA